MVPVCNCKNVSYILKNYNNDSLILQNTSSSSVPYYSMLVTAVRETQRSSRCCWTPDVLFRLHVTHMTHLSD
jgi:hypothetical protein